MPSNHERHLPSRPDTRHRLRLVRLLIALLAAVAAIAAPMLSGCIIIASDKPTTRVIHSTPAEAN